MSYRPIDLRSDTVTQPTDAMRAAMATAPVGDDVFGDDPSVNALQDYLAEQLGFAAALFVTSGTQSNLLALMAHCERGDEYLVGADAHTFKYEGGGAAVLGSIQPQPIVQGDDGRLPLDAIRAAIKPLGDPHFARSRLLALENTWHGRVLDRGYIEAAGALAKQYELVFHLDGARLYNAAVAEGVEASSITAPFDSVSVCLSKGLGAPVGSVLLGDAALIERARRWRKVVGGGWRQAGHLAAAGLYALTHHVERLADDHARAVRLADGLSAIRGIDVLAQHTNMVFIHVPETRAEGLAAHLAASGIRVAAGRGPRWRLVTHLDIDDTAVERCLQTFARCVSDAR
ncbi:MAG: low-specificity L-threonine aldolase [Aquimonas sp.]|nr:low-specificity L-threonine aldolase [Aquimonas sp.]